jgi:hypothetical protein
METRETGLAANTLTTAYSEQPKFNALYPRKKQRSPGTLAFHIVSTLAPNQPIKASQVYRALQEKDAYIYPHHRKSSPVVFQRVMTAVQTNPEFEDTEDFFAGPGHDAASQGKCLEPHCKTRFSTYGSTAEKLLLIYVYRGYGDLESVKDPL